MTLPFRPEAELFPLIEGEAFSAFVGDIAARGLRKKVVLFEGAILDGRNRYRALLKLDWIAGDEPDSRFFRVFDRALEGDPLDFVLSENLQGRRHLSDSQRAMIADAAALLKRGGFQSKKKSLASKTQAEAAAAVGVSERLVRHARVVREQGSRELAAAVKSGTIAVSLAAQAAKLPEAQQRAVVAEVEAGHANVVRTVIKRERRVQREAELGAKQQALPDATFGLILADPEHRFETWGKASGLDRAADNHYPTSSQTDIEARDVAKIAADDCLLLLWITDLARGLSIMAAWGFTCVSYKVWVKDIVFDTVTPAQRQAAGLPAKGRVLVEVGPPGTGYWSTDRDEILLIGVRGKVPCPAPGTQGESVIFAARPRDAKGRIIHSAKPVDVHEWAERHYPNLKKIELNARTARPGWAAWGNEAPEASRSSSEAVAQNSEGSRGDAESRGTGCLESTDNPGPRSTLTVKGAATPEEASAGPRQRRNAAASDVKALAPDALRGSTPPREPAQLWVGDKKVAFDAPSVAREEFVAVPRQLKQEDDV